jgi:hypothetical protein
MSRVSNPSRPAGMKLTYEDFVLFPDDGKRHELIDGAHHVTPSPNTAHQVIVGNLHLVIATWLETHPAGRIFLAPFDVVISNVDVVEPDLLFITAPRVPSILTDQHVRGTPGSRHRDCVERDASAR